MNRAHEADGVLFVCTGNTCRSPLAEYLYNSLAGSGDPAASSAGLMAHPGDPANPVLISVMRDRFGLDLTQHRSRRLTQETAHAARMIVVMEPWQKAWILDHFPETADRVRLLTEFAHDASLSGRGIPDPIGGGADVYSDTARMMEPLIRNLLGYIRSTTGSGQE